LLSIILFWEGGVNQGLQNDIQAQQVKLQQQQDVINKGQAIAQQVGPNLLNDMAVVSVKDESMKKLLATHGYNVSVASPTPSASAPKAPAAPAAEQPARLQP
jgi:hypothetical protein